MDIGVGEGGGRGKGVIPKRVVIPLGIGVTSPYPSMPVALKDDKQQGDDSGDY